MSALVSRMNLQHLAINAWGWEYSLTHYTVNWSLANFRRLALQIYVILTLTTYRTTRRQTNSRSVKSRTG